MSAVLLTGGMVFDGLGGEARRADVLVRHGRVAEIRPRPTSSPADNAATHAGKPGAFDATDQSAAPGEALEIVDCSGLAVAPGFIDIHTHSDTSGLIHPLAENRLASGVTTELCGNCGGSAFPQDDYLQQRNLATLAEHNLEFHWADGRQFFDVAERIGCGINRAFLIGHGNLRAMVMGYQNRPARPDELDRMAHLLRLAIEQGGCGLSSGLVYPPGCFADPAELVRLAKVVSEMGGIYASHIRSEGRQLLQAVDEFIETLQQARCRGILSHVKTMGSAAWPKIDHLLERLEAARSRGVQIFADRYPYLASWTGLDNMLLPDWAFEGGKEAEIDRLTNPETRRRLIQAINCRTIDEPQFFNMVKVAGCHNDKLRDMVGSSISDIAARWNLPPAEAGIRFILQDDAQSSAVQFGMNEDNLQRILQLPFVCIASDSSARSFNNADSAMAHPRTYGTPARFLGTYVRDKTLMSWGLGIRRLTSLPADIMGWADRGRLVENAWADVTVFDQAAIDDRATYQNPAVAPQGIKLVMVNGTIMYRNGQFTDRNRRPGQLLRHGGRQ